MAQAPVKLPNYAPTPIQLFPVTDFTGGVNYKADAFQLGPADSPDMMDMTPQMGGGFAQRLVVAPWGTGTATATNKIVQLWPYTTPTSNFVVCQYKQAAGTAGVGLTSDGHSSFLTGSVTAATSTLKWHSAVFNNNMYVQRGSEGAPVRIVPAGTQTAMAAAWNETIGGETGTAGNMPPARYICSHMQRVFIAYTTESGTDHPNRIRWSHAGSAEDWRQEDYIDVDLGRDGDVITGIIEFKDKLYIYKNNSISVLSGYSTSNFAITTITQDIGAVSQDAICMTDCGVFHFSWPYGVYLDRGDGPYPIFDKLYPLTHGGSDIEIPASFRSSIAMGWVNNNLWVSVPTGDDAGNDTTFVYNPWIYKNRYLRFLQGPWYPYGLGIQSFANFLQMGGPQLWLATRGDNYIGTLENNGDADSWDGSTPTAISSYFKTRWIDINSPSIQKRWRHPDFAMRAASDQSIPVEVRRDYDPETVYKTFQLNVAGPTGDLQWYPTPTTQGTTFNLSVNGSIHYNGTGTPATQSYSYQVVAFDEANTAIASSAMVTATGPNPLTNANSTNPITLPYYSNALIWDAVAGAAHYTVYGRTAGTMGTCIATTTNTTLYDYGSASNIATQTGAVEYGNDTASGAVIFIEAAGTPPALTPIVSNDLVASATGSGTTPSQATFVQSITGAYGAVTLPNAVKPGSAILVAVMATAGTTASVTDNQLNTYNPVIANPLTPTGGSMNVYLGTTLTGGTLTITPTGGTAGRILAAEYIASTSLYKIAHDVGNARTSLQTPPSFTISAGDGPNFPGAVGVVMTTASTVITNGSTPTTTTHANTGTELLFDYNPGTYPQTLNEAMTFSTASNYATFMLEWGGETNPLTATTNYIVTAVNATGAEFARSAELTFYNTSPYGTLYYNSSTDNATNYVTWNDLSSQGAVSYNVYASYGVGTGGQETLIANVPAAYHSFVDQEGVGIAIPTSGTASVSANGTGTVTSYGTSTQVPTAVFSPYSWSPDGASGATWSPQNLASEVIVRGNSMGSSSAVQLTLYAPSGKFWGCDAISLKYVPKRIRG